MLGLMGCSLVILDRMCALRWVIVVAFVVVAVLVAVAVSCVVAVWLSSATLNRCSLVDLDGNP